MIRTMFAGLALVILAFAPATAQEDEEALGPAPTITIVKLKDGETFELQRMRHVPEARTIVRRFEEDGVVREVTETAIVHVPVYETSVLSAEGLKVFDIDGNQIELQDVAERLSRPTAVLIVPGGKLTSIYRDLFQMGTLVFDMPAPSVAPVRRGVPLPRPSIPR